METTCPQGTAAMNMTVDPASLLDETTTEWVIWDEKSEAKLRQLRADGYSITQIGDYFGITRSAISGKIKRLALPYAGTSKIGRPLIKNNGENVTKARKKRKDAGTGTSLPKKIFAKKSPTQPKPPKLINMVDSHLGLQIPLIELTNRNCHWPVIGEKEHTFFCGEASLEGKRYCYHHHQRSLPKEKRDVVDESVTNQIA